MHTHHPGATPRSEAWSNDQTLHVAACVSNPVRWSSRRELAHDFRRHMRASPNVRLHFVELRYGERPGEHARPQVHPDDLVLSTTHELFHKENLLNLAVQRFPADWRYGMVCDADFVFTRWDWALETIHQLQHHKWVQPFSTYTYLSGEAVRGEGHQPIGGTQYGFAYTWHRNGCALPPGWRRDRYGEQKRGVGATGGAWAFTREGWDSVGGLLDRCALGSGDWFMAFGLVGERAPDKRYEAYAPDYVNYVEAFRERAQAVNRDVGYVDCHAVHHFHGAIRTRGYGSRDEILIRNAFSPTRDLYPDWQGVLQLTPRKPRLRDDIRAYFRSRCEDDPTL